MVVGGVRLVVFRFVVGLPHLTVCAGTQLAQLSPLVGVCAWHLNAPVLLVGETQVSPHFLSLHGQVVLMQLLCRGWVDKVK